MTREEAIFKLRYGTRLPAILCPAVLLEVDGSQVKAIELVRSDIYVMADVGPGKPMIDIQTLTDDELLRLVAAGKIAPFNLERYYYHYEN